MSKENRHKPSIPAGYVTATQAWKEMGVSNAKLARMIAAGEIPWKKDPRHKQRKLIPVSAVREFLERAGPPMRQETGMEMVKEDQAAA